MSQDRKGFMALLLTLLLASPMLTLGLAWGLPSRAADRLLFGDHPVWSGETLLSLAGGWPDAPGVGADVALHPLGERAHSTAVNADDADRARIIVRYRLYSYQPDELSTFRALSRMKPGRGPAGGLDPGLYQYGGLWIYPIGLLLRVGAWCRVIALRSDVAFYLEHPDAFARFYVVARAYSAIWGLIGVGVVFGLVRRLCGGAIAPACVAGVLLACLPVVVNGAHEAKPHLAGTVLILMTVWMGSLFVERGGSRRALATGALAGAAMGMVLSGIAAAAVLGAMVLLRQGKARERLANLSLATLAAGAVYAVTNPYVLINLVMNRAVLQSNLGTSAGMYHAGLSWHAMRNAGRLILEGTSPVLALFGIAGAALLGVRAVRDRKRCDVDTIRRRSAGLLLAAPSIWVAIQFAAFAANKPGEYGRFALLLDAMLLVEAVVAIDLFTRHVSLKNFCARSSLFGVLLLSTGVFGSAYLRGFIADAGGMNGRLQWGSRIDAERQSGARRLIIAAEPAPYCVPPVNVFDWNIQLLPRDEPVTGVSGVAACSIRAVDVCQRADLSKRLFPTAISWADKPFAFESAGGDRSCDRCGGAKKSK